MSILIAIMVAVIFAASTFLLLGRELKGVCMGVFLLGHGANLAIIAASGTPMGKKPPVLGQGWEISQLVDPLPQALILTSIVIGFSVQAFLLTLLVLTWRRGQTLEISELAEEEH